MNKKYGNGYNTKAYISFFLYLRLIKSPIAKGYCLKAAERESPDPGKCKIKIPGRIISNKNKLILILK